MSYFKSFFVRYLKDIIIGLELIAIIIIIIFIYPRNKNNDNCICDDSILLDDGLKTNDDKFSNDNLCHVDVKGQVKKSGVYEILCDSSVYDAVELAGGITKNAYTNNINLSKTIKDEMVIYIYSKKEITKQIKEDKEVATSECKSETIYINECVDNKSSLIVTGDDDSYSLNISNSNDNVSGGNTLIININTASKEQLMTLSGIGESKAISIIEYRDNNKFTSIEDIKNVSGIGDALYEKIKNYITV